MGVLVCGTHETGRGEAAIGEGGAALDKRDIGMGMDGVVRRVRGGQEPCRQSPQIGFEMDQAKVRRSDVQVA